MSRRTGLGIARRVLARVTDRFQTGWIERRVDAVERTPRFLLGSVSGAAVLFANIDKFRLAEALLQLLVRSNPEDARSHVRLGEVRLQGGEVGLVNTPVIGIEHGWRAAATSALESFERATAIDRSNIIAEIGIAHAHALRGELSVAVAHQRDIAPCCTSEMKALASSIETVGRSRGALTSDEAERLTDIWLNTLRMDPTDSAVRRKLVRHLVQVGDCSRAEQVARPSQEATATQRSQSREQRYSTSEIDWYYAQSATALAAGNPIRANQCKRTAALIAASSSVTWHSPLHHLVTRVQATSYAYGAPEALRVLCGHRPRWPTTTERLTHAKLQADLNLSQGAPEPLIDYRATWEHRTAADHSFRQLIQGRRVLVVGPANNNRPTDQDYSDADVVVSTKYPERRVATAALVVYLAEMSARLDPRTRAESEEQPHIAVLRPTTLSSAAAPPNLSVTDRVMPAEDSNTFLGTRFGIPRILYDLVQYSPASITLAGVDFYLSELPYRSGYADEADRLLSPNRLQPVAAEAIHDFWWDYRFVQHLTAAGLVTPNAGVASLLQLSDTAYLHRLTEYHCQISGPRSE